MLFSGNVHKNFWVSRGLPAALACNDVLPRACAQIECIWCCGDGWRLYSSKTHSYENTAVLDCNLPRLGSCRSQSLTGCRKQGSPNMMGCTLKLPWSLPARQSPSLSLGVAYFQGRWAVSGPWACISRGSGEGMAAVLLGPGSVGTGLACGMAAATQRYSCCQGTSTLCQMILKFLQI